MRILKHALAVAVVFGVLSQGAEAAQFTPFTLTQGTLSATFEGFPFPDGFVLDSVPPGLFQGLSGGVVVEDFGLGLVIDFSQQIAAIQFNFAQNSFGPDQLDFAVIAGPAPGTLVDSGSSPSDVPLGFAFAEGLLTYAANPFDTIAMTSLSGSEFAIDNLLVLTSTGQTYFFDFDDVPEPLTLALFGAGLLGAGVLRRRKAAL